jgi:death-on-curing protein
VQNHPFIDGNKRVGAAAAIIFLSMNDMELMVEEDALVDLVLQVACGTVGKPEITIFLRTHTQPSPSVDDFR